MTYALKLLFFVLVAGGAASFFLRPAFRHLLSPRQYTRAWVSLLVATCVAFTALHTALFFVLLAIVALVASRYLGEGDNGNVNAFMLFLVTLPPIHGVLGGLEDMKLILPLDHMRLLSVVLLTMPAIRLLVRQRTRGEPSLRSVDIAVLLIQAWTLFLIARYANFTGLARSVTLSFCDILIPYYVFTRTLKTSAQLKEAAAYLMLGLVFMGSVACVESLTQHNLYTGLQYIYNIRWGLTADLRRGGFLRVESSAPGSIVLGFCMTFALGLWTWLGKQASRSNATYAVYLILAFALVSTWARGPLLGAILLGIALVLQRWMAPRAFAMLALMAVVAGGIVKATGGDTAVIAALGSLFGSSEGDIASMTYRRDLLDATLALIQQSPWMGVPNFETALASFRQGEGIIDIVNTYLTVMINGGVVAMVLFLMPFLLLLGKLLNANSRSQKGARQVFGKFEPAFIAIIVAMLFIIFTVSNISMIPYFLGLGIALPVAWLRQAREESVATEELQPAVHANGGIPLPMIVTRPGTYR